MKTALFFSEDEKKAILKAIAEAEKQTSGEIRVHIDENCKGNVLDKAVYVFSKLQMHETQQRNGVLFYLAVNDKKFAVIGDVGVNNLVPENFWEDVKQIMLQHFQKNAFGEGLVAGISMAGEKLKQFFPYKDNDKNELSDEISFA